MSTSSQDPERQVIIPVYSHHAGPFDNEGNVVCYTHRLVAALRESKTDKNPEREFYSCSKDRSDPGRCNFFLWVDEIAPFEPSDVPIARANACDLPSTPSTWSESPRSTYAPSLQSSSPSGPSLAPQNSIYAPFSERRSDAEENLSRPRQPAQIPEPGKGPAASSSAHLLPRGSSPGPSTFKSVPHEGRLRQRRAALSGHARLPSYNGSTLDDQDTFTGTSSPSSYAPSSAPATGPGQVREGSCNLSNYTSGSVDRYTSEHTKRGVANSPSAWGSRRLPRRTPSGRARNDGVRDLSSMRPQQHTAAVPSITPSADTAAAYLEALAGIPAYIRKLERKQAASEKSVRVKTQRIAELEGKLRRLEAENAHLKAKLDLDPGR